MRKWQSHKIVEAEPIIEVVNPSTSACYAIIKSDDGLGQDVSVPADFCGRGTPKRGDYLVRYADGHLSWSPKKAFEEGYTEVKSGGTSDTGV